MTRILLLGQNPGSAEDLLVPLARILHVPTGGTTLKDIDELPYRLGGRAVKPRQALAFKDRRGDTTLLPGLGVTEAAELQDLAYALEAKRREDWRERFGLPSRASLGERIREHMAAKATYFKQHAVTDNGQPAFNKHLY